MVRDVEVGALGLLWEALRGPWGASLIGPLASRCTGECLSYLIAEVVALPLTGLLTRALTMRWLSIATLAVFTVASISCAWSGSLESLLAWRVVQGLAGGLRIPQVFAGGFMLFPDRGQAVATTIAGMLAVLAPHRRSIHRRLDHQHLRLDLAVSHQRCPRRRSHRDLREPASQGEDRARPASQARSSRACIDGCRARVPGDRVEEGAARRLDIVRYRGIARGLPCGRSLVCGAVAQGGAPVAELRTLGDPDFALGSLLSFILVPRKCRNFRVNIVAQRFATGRGPPERKESAC
jgi:hypothetical protein